MHLLFLTNYCPPFARGGYEQWCIEVAKELANRGHQVRVLTSRVPDKDVALDNDLVHVHRLLHLETNPGLWRTALRFFLYRKQHEKENIDTVKKLVDHHRPDVALLWGMWNVPRSVPALIEQLLPGRTAYYFCDYWPTLPSAYTQYWQTPSGQKWVRLPKRLLGHVALAMLSKECPAELQLEHLICVSQGVRLRLSQSILSAKYARVIYGGTHIEQFERNELSSLRDFDNRDLQLLYAGRLTADKGIHTAITALALLANDQRDRIRLDIVGRGNQEYDIFLRDLVGQHHLEEHVRFCGRVSHDEMPSLLHRYDVFLFPSRWDALPRAVLEAMAAGLVVIGTTEGGTGEILIENETGLTFETEDANGLARQIQRLLDTPELLDRLAINGHQAVRGRFDFRHMVDEIEQYMCKMAAI